MSEKKTCKQCKGEVLVEDLGGHRKRYSCSKCGLTEIRDDQGRQVLLGDRGTPSGNLLLG